MAAGNSLTLEGQDEVLFVIDGETVIIDLESGRYYSAEGVGSVIW